jgi:uncharacterized membrane protein YfcA
MARRTPIRNRRAIVAIQGEWMQRTLACPFFRKAFGWCVPIGGLAGLIGLGGGEFRLPVLMHGIGFDAKSAVPLNLMISLVTLTCAMISRSGSVSFGAIVPHSPEVIGLAVGGMASAVYSVHLVRRLSGARLVQLIAFLLIAIGALLLWEAAFPFQYTSPLPASVTAHLLSGVAIGAGIGLVSSVLGVAGGELLIPTLIFIFGADIRTAGSASILISLGIVLMGLWRYWRSDAIPQGRGIQRITFAMSAGSIIGATLGGLAVTFAPIGFLKLFLGCVLIAAAGKTMISHRR